MLNAYNTDGALYSVLLKFFPWQPETGRESRSGDESECSSHLKSQSCLETTLSNQLNGVLNNKRNPQPMLFKEIIQD